MQIVDAHHHLWDLTAVHYPWLMARGVERFFGDPAPIQKNYLVDDLRNDAADFELVGSVHIQVGAAPGDELSETNWLESTAVRDGLPSAIVAYAELERDDIEQQLLDHAKASRLRGVRQIVGRSAEEDARTGSGALLDNPRWLDGLQRLPAHGLSFDLQLTPRQTRRAAEVFAAVPDLKVALCHCGSPWDQDKSGLASWLEGIRELAENPNVYCKISGLSMFNNDWTTEDIRPIVDACIETFGIERSMFGSNFPVDKLHASYSKIWQAYDEITRDLGPDARRALFTDNARKFYRL